MHRRDQHLFRPHRARRSLALLAALAVAVAAGCGNQTDADDLRALFGESASAPAQQPADSGAAAPTPEGTPADTPASAVSDAPATPGAVGSTPATPRTAAGAASPSRAASGRPAAEAAAGSTPAQRAASSGGKAPGGKPDAAAPKPGAPGPVPQPAAPAKCTGSEAPIVLGTVGTNSGVLGEIFGGGWKAIQAWVAMINAQGGINCHPVKHFGGDDGADPARHQALVRQFVEEKKVIGFIWNPAVLSGQSAKDYLNEKKVPVVGTEGGQAFFFDSPMHFCTTSCGEGLAEMQMMLGASVAQSQKLTKLAILTCQEAQFCNDGDGIFKAAAAKYGLQTVYTGKGTLTQPDYTSQCVEMQRAGAQLLVTAFDGNSDERIMTSCKRINYKPVMVVTASQAKLDWVNQADMVGTVVAAPKRPWFQTSHPGIADFAAKLKQFSPQTPPGPSSIDGWQPAKAMETALRRTVSSPGQPPASADIVNGMYGLNGDDILGLAYPLRFAPGQRDKIVACGWPVVVGEGKFTSTTADFICAKGMEP